MSDAPDTRIALSLPPELLRAVDDYRAAHGLPSRSEAMRALLRRGLGLAGPDLGDSPKRHGDALSDAVEAATGRSPRR